MARRRLLRFVISAGASIISLLGPIPSPFHGEPAPPICTPGALATKTCVQITPEIENSAVDLRGDREHPGSSLRSIPPSADSGHRLETPGDTEPEPIRDTAGRGPANPARPIPEASTLPCEVLDQCEPVTLPVTLEDLANFIPVPGTPHMEPTGWSVAGLPTNFWISTSSHIVDGELFGQPASVRFTPAAAHFGYGDGSPTVRTPLGGSWATTDADEFTPTSTSHTYAATGVYTISVGVDFTVEYSYDGSAWIPVDGTLVSSSPPLTAQIVRASTVLVSTDCTTDPEGIGC